MGQGDRQLVQASQRLGHEDWGSRAYLLLVWLLASSFFFLLLQLNLEGCIKLFWLDIQVEKY